MCTVISKPKTPRTHKKSNTFPTNKAFFIGPIFLFFPWIYISPKNCKIPFLKGKGKKTFYNAEDSEKGRRRRRWFGLI